MTDDNSTHKTPKSKFEDHLADFRLSIDKKEYGYLQDMAKETQNLSDFEFISIYSTGHRPFKDSHDFIVSHESQKSRSVRLPVISFTALLN
jgi:hypothetical protein